MQVQQYTYHSPTYQAFKALEPTAYRLIIRFYEGRKKEIAELDDTETLELQLAYAEALFQTGNYLKHCKIAEQIITCSIAWNIQFVEGVDIYKKTLFQKAASHHNLLDNDQAIHILQELLKMDNKDRLVQRFLAKCLYQRDRKLVATTRAVAVIIYLIAVGIMLAEVLLASAYWERYSKWLENARIALVGLSLLVLGVGELWQWLRVAWQVRSIASLSKEKK